MLRGGRICSDIRREACGAEFCRFAQQTAYREKERGKGERRGEIQMKCDTLGSSGAFGMCRGRARGSGCQEADLKDGNAGVCEAHSVKVLEYS